MSLTMINGYPCFDCKDVARAKRGEDPREPDPAQARESDKRADKARADREGSPAPADPTGQGGALAAPSTVQGASPPQDGRLQGRIDILV